MKLELKITADGSSTFYLPELEEQYHSLNGAVTESKHVFLEMGFEFHPSVHPAVFEVGFGTGLNALLTAYQAEVTKRQVYYVTIEKYPLDPDAVKELDYGRFLPHGGNDLFMALHECSWDRSVQLTDCFTIFKIKGDLTVGGWQHPSNYDIVYFDAFGPDKQPEMWSQQILADLYEQLLPGGVFVTYSAKGEVRRRLIASGFKTEKLPGPPGKKEMLRGIKL